MFKILDEVCKPTKGSKYSAAIDLYAREDVVIGAGETKMIPLGVCIDLENFDRYLYLNILYPIEYYKTEKASIAYHFFENFIKSHYLQLEPRSSLRAKGLISGTGIIDIDFVPNCKINKVLNNGKCSHFKPKTKV